MADAPVLLVADIDRGGVFASLVGTLELLEPEERERVKGLIINKFRGDVRLLQSGLDWLEEKTRIPVLGVIPYQKMLYIESEDSAALDQRMQRTAAAKVETMTEAITEKPDLDIAVIRLPYLSNFTDLDPLTMEPDVNVRYVQHLSELGNPDAIILPGTKNTVYDLGWLWRTGIAAQIVKLAHFGTPVIGICGGYQMLGKTLFDPNRVESDVEESKGLGLLDCETSFESEKRTLQAEGTVQTLFGWSLPEEISISYLREAELDRWAGVVREAIDLNRVYQIMGI